MSGPTIRSAEQWRTIPSFPDYEASDYGRIRRPMNRFGVVINLVLSQYLHPQHGYLYVSPTRNKKQYSRRVHALVAEAFLGRRPDGMEVNHRDFDRTHNVPSNLEYLTHADNNRHSAAVGRIKPPPQIGEKSPTAKLTAADVREIRRLSASGLSNAGIAARYNMNRNTMLKIVTRKLWAHVA